jgi:hypothetical protein
VTTDKPFALDSDKVTGVLEVAAGVQGDKGANSWSRLRGDVGRSRVGHAHWGQRV